MPVDELDDDVGDDDVKKGGRDRGGRGKPAGGAVAGPGLSPLYLSDAGLDKYSMKKGTRVTDIVAFKLLPKADIIKEIEELGDQCDFFALKDAMQEYEGDQFLLIRGPENEFEYNYLWCSTLDSYEDHLQEMNERASGANLDKDRDVGGFDDDDGDDDDEGEGRSKRGKRGGFDKGDDGLEKAAVKRPVEAMTEIEIATLQVKTHRPPLGFYISQSRFKFGKPVDFDDVEPAEKLAEYRHSKIPHYNDERLVLEMGFQAAPVKAEMATQTFWLNSVNKATQYVPAGMSDAEREELLSSPALAAFLSGVEELVTRELQMNETIDIFKDEFREFEEEEVSLGNRLENNLEVFHSFSHYRYSKGKNINAVQWLPPQQHSSSLGGGGGGAGGGGAGGRGMGLGLGGAIGPLVAFSCSNNVTFDQWVDQSGKVLTSSILIYSLADVLHPWLVLEVPGNIQCFKVHPSHPEYIVAGLATGQVIFWDLTDAREKVRLFQNQQAVNQHAYNRAGKNNANAAAGGGGAAAATGAAGGAAGGAGGAGSGGNGSGESSSDSSEESVSIPPIKYTVLSYIDRSHSRPVTDLVWVPAAQQLNRKGEVYVAEKGVSSQFASVASDGKLLIWDFKNRNDGAAAKASAAAAAAAMGGGGSLAARVAAASDDADAKEPRWAPIFTLALSRAENQGVVTVTKLALGEGSLMMSVTEDGEMVELDAGARATEERARPDTVRSIQRAHFAAAASVERSPHFSDIYLTVGDWTFSIWKVGIDQPVFTSSCSAEYLSAGRWSPTRPGIIVTARADGTIDVWDLVDQCHKSSLNFQTGFADGLSSLEFWQSKNSSQQYLAAGDIGGKLHIIEIPRNLRRKIANEENLMRLFYEREIARTSYCQKRNEVGRARAAKEAQLKAKTVSIIAPSDDPANPAGAAAASGAPPGSAAAAAQAARDEKANELAAKEKADKLRQLEEEKAEKEYQRMLDQFKQTLAAEDLADGAAVGAATSSSSSSGSGSQMRK